AGVYENPWPRLLPMLEQQQIADTYVAFRKLGVGGADQTKWPVGGRGALIAFSAPVMRCPADALPADGQLPHTLYPPGDPMFPLGIFYGVATYGFNWGTQLTPRMPFPYLGQSMPKDGVFHINTRTKWLDVTDGTGQTIMVGERAHFDPNWQPALLPNAPTLMG